MVGVVKGEPALPPEDPFEEIDNVLQLYAQIDVTMYPVWLCFVVKEHVKLFSVSYKLLVFGHHSLIKNIKQTPLFVLCFQFRCYTVLFSRSIETIALEDSQRPKRNARSSRQMHFHFR